MGILRGTFDQLWKAGCIQTGNDGQKGDDEPKRVAGFRDRWPGLMQLCNFDPCTTGCPEFRDGKCKAYQQYHTQYQEEQRKEQQRRERSKDATRAPGTAQFPGLSVKQIADQLGISKNEVRRRKQAGTL